MKNNIVKSAKWISLGSLLVTSAARANDSFNSEMSHVIGNAVLASATTVVVDKYWPEIKTPARTGFMVSAGEVILAEVVQYSLGNGISLLDTLSGVFGAAIGSYATDTFYIAPKMTTQAGETTYGVTMTHRF